MSTPIGASALPLHAFTFDAFHGLTPSLTGPERAALFGRLPQRLQAAAWKASAASVAAHNTRLAAEQEGDR